MCERKKNDIIHYLISHFRSKERKRQHIAPDFVVDGREATYEGERRKRLREKKKDYIGDVV